MAQYSPSTHRASDLEKEHKETEKEEKESKAKVEKGCKNTASISEETEGGGEAETDVAGSLTSVSNSQHAARAEEGASDGNTAKKEKEGGLDRRDQEEEIRSPAESHPLQTDRGGTQYQLVFMDEMSSESSLTGSLSPQTLEFSTSYPQPPPPPSATAAVQGTITLSPGSTVTTSTPRTANSTTALKIPAGQRELDESRSTVSESTLVACSNLSGESDNTLEEEGMKSDRGGTEGGGEEVDGAENGRGKEEQNGIITSVIADSRSESETPSPKLKGHLLTTYTSDSEVIITTPPFSPLAYQSLEEGGENRSFLLPTPSPLPSGTSSPVDTQPVMSILFSGVYYLGSSTVDAPISETEANRKMHILHEQALTSHPMPIILSVPVTNDGSVFLRDPKMEQPLTTFPIKMILFCARGNDESLQDCFCFNVRHKRSGIYHCHVFQCEIMEATHKIFEAIGKAFKSKPERLLSPTPTPPEVSFEVDIGVEIMEDDGKGNFTHVAVDKDMFKLRQNTRKKVTITIYPYASNPRLLVIERCFGILLSHGRNLEHSQMNLLDNMNVGEGENKAYSVSGFWEVGFSFLAALNEETPKSVRCLYLTIAADLVLESVNEPVRFKREVKVRVSKGDLFGSLLTTSWTKRKISPEPYVLILKKVVNDSLAHYEVVELKEGGLQAPKGATPPSSSPDIPLKEPNDSAGTKIQFPVEDIPVVPLTAQRRKTLKSQVSKIKEEHEGDSDGSGQPDEGEDDAMISGWGETDDMREDLLKDWGELLDKWNGKLKEKSRPKQLVKLCRKGIPKHLRCQVWQMLSGAAYDPQLLEAYRLLLPKESPAETIINWDIQRTYLGHDFFHAPVGKEVLYKISKAYSIYDEEVGYCQGISFIIAVLLLQKMPEEQAFAVLIKIMYQYHHRDVFKANFHQLHLMFYQLDRLMKEHMESLHSHFKEQGVETHMYASQWFLTIYTAKFPLSMVFRVMDSYLCEGALVMFQVALSILKIVKSDLKQLDFEGILTFFREGVPKRFQTEEACDELFRTAYSFKLKERKLKDFEKDYPAYLEQQAELEDPVKRLEGTNKLMRDNIQKLMKENEHLTHELVVSKTGLRGEMDKLEERIDMLSKESRTHKMALDAAQLQMGELREELQQAKGEYQKVMMQLMEERQQHAATVAEYKQLAQQMDEGHQKQTKELNQELLEVKAQLSTQTGERKPISEGKLRKLEMELAQTKLALVESQCCNQELEKKLECASNTTAQHRHTRNTSFLGRGKKKT